ncbi:hypothetical protein OS493_026369 [Desmophyllum pertusum]|uniref:Uncharacterized protein n=1 Tax=Desmophyllum pertusum TaxID=174260 RepID=A0A9X0CVQ4_9CNID|nr:hypothetical protein OS493_026369 [Desmophyllum pertusum]
MSVYLVCHPDRQNREQNHGPDDTWFYKPYNEQLDVYQECTEGIVRVAIPCGKRKTY